MLGEQVRNIRKSRGITLKTLSYDVTLDTRKTFARLAFSLNSFA